MLNRFATLAAVGMLVPLGTAPFAFAEPATEPAPPAPQSRPTVPSHRPRRGLQYSRRLDDDDSRVRGIHGSGGAVDHRAVLT